MFFLDEHRHEPTSPVLPCPHLHSQSKDNGEHISGCPHVASLSAARLSLLVSARPSARSLMPVPGTDGGRATQ